MTDKWERALAVRLDNELERGTATVLNKDWGVSAQFLSDVRKGRRRIGPALLDKLCDGVKQ